jgi:UDP-4-amino-4,6-dideoxy-N-acetyl-beta-L-altrosamine transaminase
MIPYAKQNINQADIDAVIDALNSDFLTQGPMVPRFERAVADYVQARYAIAVNSATSALHLACLALDLQPGDWLWTSPNTFVASANCALYCGAKVDFVDIDPQTYNLSVEKLQRKLAEAEQLGRLPKIVVPVHFSGQSCDMAAIYKLGQQYGFKIIEDASHAIGGRYQAKMIGSCQYSDITVFSFHPVKIITTGEGGMTLTNDSHLAERMCLLRSHGITRDAEKMSESPISPWYYQQLALGFNYRMTDIQAALGLSQMVRISEFVQRRQESAYSYDTALASLPLILPFQNIDSTSAFHLYVIKLDEQSTEIDRKTLYDCLRKVDIGVNVHYIPVHMQPYYQSIGFSAGDFPEAEYYYQHALSLPMYASLTADEQVSVIEALRVLLHE